MKKVVFVCLCSLLCLCGCNNQNDNLESSNKEQLEKAIIENLNKIMEVSDLTSSNPYDYTKNVYYNNIVDLGEEAIPVLKNMYKNGKLNGISAFLSALAIQDITKCNVYDEYNIDWSTAEEFYTLWEENNCSFGN